MFKNYGIEESNLADEEVIDYFNYNGNIDFDSLHDETILAIIESYVDKTGDVSLEYMDDYMGGNNW